MQVLVCHPGRQHSHQLAMALAEHGMLAKYVTGVPTRGDAGGWLARRLVPGKTDSYAIDIDPALVRHVYFAKLVSKAAAMACPPKMTATISHRADALFDAWVCRWLSSERPHVVVAYENSALHTFRRAKRLGITTVLDAASVHHRWQDRFIEPPQSKIAHRLTNARKDAEIALADHVLTVSAFARESYLDAGVSPARVYPVPVGVDYSQFKPRSEERRVSDRPAHDFRFVYVGNTGRLKGLDILSDAVRRLRHDGQECTVTMIGAGAETAKGLDTEIKRKGWMNHERLARELPQHDVLILPSYFDSFGMVVAEAMACGLPVIVTQNVGAKEMVTPEVNGQVVPVGDAEALASAMRWFLANRAKLPGMSQAARLAAERYDWWHYRRRVVELLQSL